MYRLITIIFSVRLRVRVTERTDPKYCQNGKTQWMRATFTDKHGDECDGTVFRPPEAMATIYSSLAPNSTVEIRRPAVKEPMVTGRGQIELGFTTFTTVRPVEDDGSLPMSGFKNATTVEGIIQDYLPDCRVGKFHTDLVPY